MEAVRQVALERYVPQSHWEPCVSHTGDPHLAVHMSYVFGVVYQAVREQGEL